MRRSIATAVAALATSLALLPGVSAAEPPTDVAAELPPAAATAAEEALAAAADVVAAAPAAVRDHGPVEPTEEATLVLRDLFLALPSLRGEDRDRARAIMARPTDGTRDHYQDGYRTRSRKRCGPQVCVHYVTRTEDRVPSRAWVRKNLRVLTKVWRRQVGDLGYRAPVADGRRGGSDKFDVYLKDVGTRGMYGYCVPEARRKGTRTAAGYCVLDNDFSAAQFGAPPGRSLRVTAAHEFFHAVQFAYDFAEDRWLLETTATWMEERVADSANDNRQYLASGQVQSPGRPLDVFQPTGFAQYGNWAFWEHVSSRFGDGLVKRVWQRAASYPGAPNEHSADALRSALGKRGGGLPAVFAAYAASNTSPARYYAEGAAWPQAPVARERVLSADARRATTTVRVDHLAAQTVLAVPDPSLAGPEWRLRVVVDGPGRSASPAAHLLVRNREGTWSRRAVRLGRDGRGRAAVTLDATAVSGVSVTLANASTRFRCGRATDYSCRGKPRDDDQLFEVRLTAVRR